VRGTRFDDVTRDGYDVVHVFYPDFFLFLEW
jgi:hypothetical protein